MYGQRERESVCVSDCKMEVRRRCKLSCRELNRQAGHACAKEAKVCVRLATTRAVRSLDFFMNGLRLRGIVPTQPLTVTAKHRAAELASRGDRSTHIATSPKQKHFTKQGSLHLGKVSPIAWSTKCSPSAGGHSLTQTRCPNTASSSLFCMAFSA